jgi:hypothetical protein
MGTDGLFTNGRLVTCEKAMSSKKVSAHMEQMGIKWLVVTTVPMAVAERNAARDRAIQARETSTVPPKKARKPAKKKR